MKKLAILITVHNRMLKTLDCLQNIHTQLPIQDWNIDIFMTDDGCTDGTPETVSIKFPDVKIIPGDGKLFWNRGMRKAWAKAVSNDNYDAYLWLNDDTVLLPCSISKLLKIFFSKPDSIIIGATSSSDGTTVTYGGKDKTGKTIIPNGSLQTCETFNGNIVLVPSSVYAKVGNLDYHYSHSLGDIDYGLSAKKEGFNLLLAPECLGKCDKNELPPKWLRTDLPFRERVSNLFSPLAYTNPKEYYYFKKKHWNHFVALLALCSISLHFFFPNIWSKIKKI